MQRACSAGTLHFECMFPLWNLQLGSMFSPQNLHFECIFPLNLQFGCMLQLQFECMLPQVGCMLSLQNLQLNCMLLLSQVCALQVRSLCRKQFFVRALGMKVAARQHKHASPRVQSTARSTPYSPQPDRGVHMTQGDSWANTGILSNPLAAQRS